MVDVTSFATASTTPGTNASVNGTSILGTGLVSTADDTFRNMNALNAKFYSDFGGTGTPGGTANAVTYTTPTVYTAYVAGMRIRFTPGANNTSAATLNLDGIGAKAIRKISAGTDIALVADDLANGIAVDLVYSTAANSAAGGWIIDRPTGNFYAYSNDAGAALAPTFEAFRDSASPAVNDILGIASFTGRSSTGVKRTFGTIGPIIQSPTNAAEASQMQMQVMVAGTLTTVVPITTIRIQTFTANGTYTPNANMVYCIIECVGAGGGGGGVTGAGAGTAASAGAGGGGSYARKISTAATVGASQTVTVPAGGTGATAGNNSGTAGSDTSVGAICVGKGGSAGGGGSSGTGGAGGVVGTGDLRIPGGNGGGGQNQAIVTVGVIVPNSGGSMYGAGLPVKTTGADAAGTGGGNYGVGGQPAAAFNSGTAIGGGAGSGGLVIITEFCSA